jgi:hypothetical protein
MFDFFHKRPYLLYSLIAGFFVLIWVALGMLGVQACTMSGSLL